jgi:hypothetical protein
MSNQPWICPHCNRANAPFLSSCCYGKKTEIESISLKDVPYPDHQLYQSKIVDNCTTSAWLPVDVEKICAHGRPSSDCNKCGKFP